MKVTHSDKYKFLDKAFLQSGGSLSSTCLQVLYFIVSTFNFNKQYCYYHTEEQIAATTGLSVSSVKRAIRLLEKERWIKVESRKRHCNKYLVGWWRITSSMMAQNELLAAQNDGASGLRSSHVMAQNDEVEGSSVSHKPLTLTFDSKPADSKPTDSRFDFCEVEVSDATPSMKEVSSSEHMEPSESHNDPNGTLSHKDLETDSLHDDGGSYWEKRFHRNPMDSKSHKETDCLHNDDNSFRPDGDDISFRTDTSFRSGNVDVLKSLQDYDLEEVRRIMEI
jgi:hypothetical protein